MKNIEIITAQNVVLQYELAGLKERALAFLLDFVCLIIGLFILWLVGIAITAGSETGLIIVVIFICVIFFFYSLVMESLNDGKSIGKMVLRIQVIKVAGGQATFSDYAARWAFRMVDIWFSLGAIASILVMSSAKGQRIGDVVANTAVVKTQPQMDLNLQDILTLHRQNANPPQYLAARKLHEEDALLIKSTLDRYRKFKNDAHEEAVHLLAERIKKLLEIETQQYDEVRFLQTILQDYVILTR
jgi:uncharacterized RDD family membrane protein YckC